MSGARDKLVDLMKQLRARQISVPEFAAKYESAWNFELEKGDVGRDEAEILERVFDTAAWYTPVEEDRESYPGFKSGEAVLAVVEGALERLGE